MGFTNDNAPLIGADCSNTGTIGLFSDPHGTWIDAITGLSPLVSRTRVEVLRLARTDSGISALLSLSDATGTKLVTVWERKGSTVWTASPALQLTSSQSVASLGPTTGDGTYVVLSDGSKRSQVDVVYGPGSPWEALPSPGFSVSTVAFSKNGRIDALTSLGRNFEDYVLNAALKKWRLVQTQFVDILYGSSS